LEEKKKVINITLKRNKSVIIEQYLFTKGSLIEGWREYTFDQVV